MLLYIIRAINLKRWVDFEKKKLKQNIVQKCF